MIRLLLISFLLFLSLDAKVSTDEKIKKTSSKLHSVSSSYSNIHKKMSQTAKAILKQKKEISLQEAHLSKLIKELGEKESSYKANTSQLQELVQKQKELKDEQKKLEEELVFTIAQNVSLSVVLEEKNTATPDAMIEFEVLKVMLQNSKEKVKRLNTSFYKNAKNINILNSHASTLEASITNIDAKRKDLLETQKRNKTSLEKLEKDKKKYKKDLKKILKKQDEVKRTLAKLNIIKIDEIKKAKEEEERRIAFSKKNTSSKNLPKVKKVGSSYQNLKTKKYRGKKTIAPLDGYTITKKYGTYTDPIYGIKIFNESISLKPKFKNAKVKTVFNGKVIYADKTAVLNNIVIVEHSNGLHTIYANLTQISPNIKKGKKIKKGYTIGRVSDELIFEVTQKSYHINPIRLFK